MTHDEIKKALKDKDISFSALAKASGKRYQTLTACSMRNAISKPAAQIICAGIGKSLADVFPDVPQYLEPSREQRSKESVEKAREMLSKAGIEAA